MIIDTRLVILLLVCISAVNSHEVHSVQGEKTDPAELLFSRLFRHRRAEQLAAVRDMTALASADKRRKMCALVAERLVAVLATSRDVLNAAGFLAGTTRFPAPDSPAIHALSNVLENVALFADVSLRLPDATAPLAAHDVALLRWGLRVARDSRLLDVATLRLLDLLEQQLQLVPRDPDFVNPFAPVRGQPSPTVSPPRARARRKASKKPRLSPPVHSEL